MSVDFASVAIPGKSKLICVGGLTRAEAEAANVDPLGHYLFLADDAQPTKPIQVLGHFLSATEAEVFARAIRASDKPRGI